MLQCSTTDDVPVAAGWNGLAGAAEKVGGGVMVSTASTSTLVGNERTCSTNERLGSGLPRNWFPGPISAGGAV